MQDEASGVLWNVLRTSSFTEWVNFYYVFFLSTDREDTKMLFQKTMKRALAERGYKHCAGDDNLSLHGEYARNVQYAFSKEIMCGHDKIVDIISLSADMHAENMVIGFFRENVSIENGMIEDGKITIPLAKFSIDEFEKQVDKLISRKIPVNQHAASSKHTF
jgi:hypothetical protein